MNTINREGFDDVLDYEYALFDHDLDTLFQKAQSGDLPALKAFCNNYIHERLFNIGAHPSCGVSWNTGRPDPLRGISERLALSQGFENFFPGEVSATRDHEFLREQLLGPLYHHMKPGAVYVVGFVSKLSQKAGLKCEFIAANASRVQRSISGLLDYNKDKDLIERYLLALLRGDSYRVCRLGDY